MAQGGNHGEKWFSFRYILELEPTDLGKRSGYVLWEEKTNEGWLQGSWPVQLEEWSWHLLM